MSKYTGKWPKLSGSGKANMPGSRTVSSVLPVARWRIISVLILLLVIGTLIFIWGGTAYRVGVDRSRDVTALQVNQSALVRDYAARLLRNIRYDERVLTLMSSDYALSGEKVDFDLYASVFSDMYEKFWLIDKNGQIISMSGTRESGADVHDFTYLAPKLVSGKLYIGDPSRNSGSQQWCILMARALKAPDGSYQGAIVLQIGLEQFSAFNVRPGTVDPAIRTTTQLSSLKTDATGGTATAATPQMDHMMLYALDAAGNAIRTPRQPGQDDSEADAADPDNTLWTSKRLDPYPLLLSIKLSDQVPVNWEEQSRVGSYILFAAIPTILISLTFFLGYGLLRRQYSVIEVYESRYQDAQEISEMKSHYVATIVHELRSPLNGIHGFSELIRDESQDPSSREFADLIHRSAIHLHGLVNTLFDVARVESGRVIMVQEPIETRPFFAHLGAMQEIVAHKNKLNFSMTLDESLPPQFHGDRMRLAQIVNNVLDNAIKFTSEGGIYYDVSTERSHLLITIRDTGMGMSEVDQKHLFQYYFQSESVQKRNRQGLGLGLSLARDFAELMNGDISVRSVLGQGTTVEIRLPCDLKSSSGTPGAGTAVAAKAASSGVAMTTSTVPRADDVPT